MHKWIKLNNKLYIFIKLIITYYIIYIYKLYQLNTKIKQIRIVTHLGVGLERGSKCETKKNNTPVMKFCFWSVWFFKYAHCHSLGIGVNSKRFLGLENV